MNAEPPTNVITYGSTDAASSPSSDSADARHVSDDEARAVRRRMEIMIAFALLKRKYRAHVLFYTYFSVFLGFMPLGVFLFLQLDAFADWYIRNSWIIHMVINATNSVLFYLYLASGFNLHHLFSMLRVEPLYGNLFVCINSGLLFGMESIDQVAVYLRLGSIDTQGIFHGLSEEGEKLLFDSKGMSADSWLLLVVYGLALFATFMALLNVCHFCYYANVYNQVVRGSMDDFRDEDGALML